MASLEDKFIILELDSELQNIYTLAKNSLKRSLPEYFEKNSPFTVHLLARRYVDCFSEDFPINLSPRILTDYLNEESELYSPVLAAQSCEFYGGIMFESLNSRKSIFSIRDFEFSLSLVYGILAKNNQNYIGLCEIAPNILEGFRHTTNRLGQNKVIELSFR